MMRQRANASGDSTQTPGPTLYSLMIVNKSGGLVYNKEFVPTEASLDLNDTLRAASIWHSLHAISAQVSPVGGGGGAAGGAAGEKGSSSNASSSATPTFSSSSTSSNGGGAVLLRASTFDLHCFQTLTGTKFLATVSPGAPEIRELLSNTIYNLYCDFVLKNPFYEVEMPIRCELFDQALLAAAAVANKRSPVAAAAAAAAAASAAAAAANANAASAAASVPAAASASSSASVGAG